MRVERLELPELVLLTPRRFADDRGWFAETYNQRAVDEALGGAAVSYTHLTLPTKA